MKNASSLFILALSFWIVLPSVCFSTFMIELKSGQKFITEHYWEENGQIRFTLYGGVAGFKKGQITGIEESNQPYNWVPSESAPEHDSTKKLPGSDELESSGEEAQSTPPPLISENEKAEILKKRDWIKKQHKKAAEQLKAAREQNDPENIKIAQQRLNNVNKKFSHLLKTVRKQNNGVVPEWF